MSSQRERRSRTITVGMAAFVALTFGAGTATGAALITGADIQDGSLTTADYQDGSVRAADINQGAVWSSDVRDENLTGKDIQDGSLTNGDLDIHLAEVQMAGTLGRSTGLATSSVRVGTTGTYRYRVTFGRDVSACYPMATAQYLSLKADANPRLGYPNQIEVYILNGTDSSAAAFRLALFC